MLVVLGLVAGLASAACEAFFPPPAFDPGQCDVRRLDEVADPAGLFRAIPCVIVTWDTAMDGAAIGADGMIGTPPALVAAAADRGFASPCETNMSTGPGAVGLPWFADRFGALDSEAEYWGVTLFAQLPFPDGAHPACVAITPTSP